VVLPREAFLTGEVATVREDERKQGLLWKWCFPRFFKGAEIPINDIGWCFRLADVADPDLHFSVKALLTVECTN
jgi:hypothetical protein